MNALLSLCARWWNLTLKCSQGNRKPTRRNLQTPQGSCNPLLFPHSPQHPLPSKHHRALVNFEAFPILHYWFSTFSIFRHSLHFLPSPQHQLPSEHHQALFINFEAFPILHYWFSTFSIFRHSLHFLPSPQHQLPSEHHQELFINFEALLIVYYRLSICEFPASSYQELPCLLHDFQPSSIYQLPSQLYHRLISSTFNVFFSSSFKCPPPFHVTRNFSPLEFIALHVVLFTSLSRKSSPYSTVLLTVKASLLFPIARQTLLNVTILFFILPIKKYEQQRKQCGSPLSFYKPRLVSKDLPLATACGCTVCCKNIPFFLGAKYRFSLFNVIIKHFVFLSLRPWFSRFTFQGYTVQSTLSCTFLRDSVYETWIMWRKLPLTVRDIFWFCHIPPPKKNQTP